jgi:hypothetical protein
MSDTPLRCPECKQKFSRRYMTYCKDCDGQQFVKALLNNILLSGDARVRPTLVCKSCYPDHEQDHILRDLGGDE